MIAAKVRRKRTYFLLQPCNTWMPLLFYISVSRSATAVCYYFLYAGRIAPRHASSLSQLTDMTRSLFPQAWLFNLYLGAMWGSWAGWLAADLRDYNTTLEVREGCSAVYRYHASPKRRHLRLLERMRTKRLRTVASFACMYCSLWRAVHGCTRPFDSLSRGSVYWRKVAQFYALHFTLCAFPFYHLYRGTFPIYPADSTAVYWVQMMLHWWVYLPVSLYSGWHIQYMTHPPSPLRRFGGLYRLVANTGGIAATFVAREAAGFFYAAVNDASA